MENKRQTDRQTFCKYKKETDRQTDILRISRLLLFLVHFLFCIHIMISPQIYRQDFMVPSCSLSFAFLLFTSCVSLLTWAPKAWLICHRFQSFHLLALLPTGLNIIHKCHKCAQHPHLGPSPSVLCVTLVLTWAKP